MTSKERFLAALRREPADRLPVTTHHVMEFFLKQTLNGISDLEFFEMFGLDPIRWVMAFRPDPATGARFDPEHTPGAMEGRRVVSDSWRISTTPVPDPEYPTVRYTITTPKGVLTTVLQSNEHTTWVAERLVKEKSDIDLIAAYGVVPVCDVAAVNREAEAFGTRGMLRGHVATFEIYGQPGCWQDAACLYGIEDLIYATADDPEWVHQFLEILCQRKAKYIRSLAWARYDLIEHGGGDASSTVISPKIFDAFVAPYDARLIVLAHEAGQRIVYHTCGGMMPLLERLAGMGPDALETFTPADMGGDTKLGEAKRRIGEKVCMIGGFDQFHYFTGCTPEETREAVRRCFAEAGEGGGYILSPSDHFFSAEPELLRAFADEARQCTYR
jgi:hypothetical protein